MWGRETETGTRFWINSYIHSPLTGECKHEFTQSQVPVKRDDINTDNACKMYLISLAELKKPVSRR